MVARAFDDVGPKHIAQQRFARILVAILFQQSGERERGLSDERLYQLQLSPSVWEPRMVYFERSCRPLFFSNPFFDFISPETPIAAYL